MVTKKKAKVITPANEFEEFETEEEKKEKKLRKKEAEKDVDALPETGLYNADGYLFYHTNPDRLTKPQQKRVAEHGINLYRKIPFSVEENVLIFKNWKTFAEEKGMRLEKAEEYISAKKSEKHVIKHQAENHFWPKLCHGMPHRSVTHVKQRAEAMLTEAFIKTLKWDDLENEVVRKYFIYDEYDEQTLQQVKKLLEKGYSMTHVAELLNLRTAMVKNIGQKLASLEKREDPLMVEQFFEAAQTFGFDYEKVREHLESGDKVSFHLLPKSVKIKEMSLKMHMTQQRIREFLKKFLRKIWEKYHEKEGEDDEKAKEEKYEEAMAIISSKPPLTQSQTLRAVEIFCKNVKKEDTAVDLLKSERLSSLIKDAGITGFSCNKAEFRFIHRRINDWLLPLDTHLFRNLRREFRYQVRLHILLWTWKFPEWSKLKFEDGETRYEAVLRHEMSNPLASKMTKKFLRNENVAEWITEPRIAITTKTATAYRRTIGIELFILYCDRKYGSAFKFPRKLRSKMTKSSRLIRRMLKRNSEDVDDDEDENSEYLAKRDVKETVETGTGQKMLTKVSSKLLVEKYPEDSESESEDENSGEEDVKPLLEHAKAKESKWVEETEKKIKKVLEKADPSRIFLKRRRRPIIHSEDEDEEDEMELSESILRQNQEMRRVAEKWKKRELMGREKVFTSKERVESSDEEDSEDEDVGEPNCGSGSDLDDSQVPEATESVEKPKKHRKLKNRDSEDVPDGSEVRGTFEDVQKIKKLKKSKNRDSDDVPDDSNLQENSEDAPKPKKQKKSKNRDSDDVADGSEARGTSEDVQKSKKHRNSKNRDSEDIPIDSEALEAPIPSEDPEDVPSPSKKHKKSKKRRYEDSEGPEDVKKQKKSKHWEVDDLEDAPVNSEAPEGPQDSEDGKKSKKHKKSKHRDVLENSEDVPVNSEVPEDVEKRKKKKKSKKKNREFEDVEE